MKKLSTIFLVILLAIVSINHSYGQITGVFGGNASASGYTHEGNTANKWLKIGELTLNGAYNGAGFTVELFPLNSNHGDAHEQLDVHFRNNSTGGTYQSTYDISLLHFTGQFPTIKDVKVIHTSGSGLTNNKLSVWVKMGNSWIKNVPMQVRKYGGSVVHTTNQPYYSAITETGTIYNLQTYYGMKGDEFSVSGTVKSEEILVEAAPWPDYVFTDEYELKSLTEVSEFISENGHLPNIPSAEEVETNGVALGKMNASLLEKIEELTLYTIDQESKLKAQGDTLKQQQNLLHALIERIEKLESSK